MAQLMGTQGALHFHPCRWSRTTSPLDYTEATAVLGSYWTEAEAQGVLDTEQAGFTEEEHHIYVWFIAEACDCDSMQPEEVTE